MTPCDKFGNLTLSAAKMHCPVCNECVPLNIEYKPRCSSHMAACMLFLCMCWCFSCIPYLMDIYEHAECSCARCGTKLGKYKFERC